MSGAIPICARRLTFLLVGVVFAAADSAAFDETLAALKARAETASIEDRAELSVRIAQLDLRDADRLYNEGKADDARAAVEDLVTYAQKASDAAIQSDKHLKNIEIATRKMSEKLRDIKRTLAFEDQPPIDQAIHRLEDMRTALLNAMFKKKDKK